MVSFHGSQLRIQIRMHPTSAVLPLQEIFQQGNKGRKQNYEDKKKKKEKNRFLSMNTEEKQIKMKAIEALNSYI